MIGAEITRKVNMTAQDVLKRLRPRIEAGLRAVGKVLLDESQKLVTIDTSALKSSGHTYSQGSGDSFVVIVGYGREGFEQTGTDRHGKIVTRRPREYALYVHQNIQRGHHLDGVPFFLHDPLMTRHAEMRQALYSAIFTG